MEIKNYFDIKVKLTLKENFSYYNSFEILSNLIFKAMELDEDLKKLHKKNTFKNYSFCTLYPIEKNGVYKKGQFYFFNIRSNNLNFVLKINSLIQITQDKFLEVISSSIKNYNINFISSLKTLTPCIATFEKLNWTKKNSLDILMSQINSNAVKKYKFISNDNDFLETEDYFFEGIKILNDKPIKLPYKNTHFLGNKIEIFIKSDSNSQIIARTLMSSGILEKNSLGFGFVLPKYL